MELLNKLGSGTTFKELSGSKLSQIEIPLPSLPDQQIIVKILDEAFEKIDKAKSIAGKKTFKILKIFLNLTYKIFLQIPWEIGKKYY